MAHAPQSLPWSLGAWQALGVQGRQGSEGANLRKLLLTYQSSEIVRTTAEEGFTMMSIGPRGRRAFPTAFCSPLLTLRVIILIVLLLYATVLAVVGYNVSSMSAAVLAVGLVAVEVSQRFMITVLPMSLPWRL
jgi:hypothetical protein